MTTTIKPVRRETLSCFRSRPLIIELHPTWVSIRMKRSRIAYSVTIDQIWNLGARNAAEALRREREQRRKEKAKQNKR